MDAEEKLTALKKAYADVIFNISKEATMRVMSSERRAAPYLHELKVGKEEALRMLMRLKQMMDSKIRQSGIASQNQQQKIEELEAQLEEAEDIVKDLRDELGEANAELERLKKDNLQHSNEPTNYAFSRKMENGIYSFKSTEFLHLNSQRNECCKCNSKIVCTSTSYIRNQDLPFITMLMRGKEPGLYRNGCTQRIRACERNLSDKALCFSGETDRVNDDNSSSEQRHREQEEGEDTSKAPASGAKTLSELEKKLLADNNLINFQSFPQKKKRTTRVRKNVRPLSGRHVPDLVKDNARLSETARMLSEVKTETLTHLGFEKSSGKETNLVENSGGIVLQKDEGLKEKMVPFEDETGFAESLSPPDCKIDVEKVDVPSNVLEPNSSYVTKGLHSESVGERVIKYTFQRKRKREASSGSKVNATTLEAEKKTEAKQNGDQNMEQSKTGLLKESSRDSRRLAQVARQLISLSEKKWWN